MPESPGRSVCKSTSDKSATDVRNTPAVSWYRNTSRRGWNCNNMQRVESKNTMSHIRKAFGINHCIAECRNCGWRNENYKNAQATAAIHAQKYKHKVVVDIGIGGYYDGRELRK